MAQAGFTPISLFHSTTAAAVPTSGNLVAGELALNTVDEKLYFKNSGGTVKLLASNATSAPVLSFSAGTTGLTPNTATTGAVTLAGTLAVANGGTNASTASITSFNNITGFTASGATGTTSTNLVFSTSPVLTTPTLGVATATSLQGIIGNVTPAAGSFTTVTASTAIGTASGGTGLGGATPFTSGGVMFASSASALTTGSVLSFDGTNLGIGTNSPSAKLDITTASAGFSAIKLVQTGVRTWAIENTGTSGLFKIIEAGVSDRLVIDASGNVGIGTSNPTQILDVKAPSARSLLTSTTGTNAVLFQENNTGGALNIGIDSSTGGSLFGATGYAAGIVHTGNYPLYLGTNNAIRATIDGAGNVGIGTSSPAIKLEVASANEAFRITGSNAFGTVTDGTVTTYLGAVTGGDVGGYTGTVSNHYYAIRTNNTERLRITSAGDVGIGTSSPTQPLTVQADSSAEAVAIIGRATGNASRIDFQNNANTTRLFAIAVGNAAVDIYADANVPMVFSTNNAERARIPAAGGFQSKTTISVGDATPSTSGAGITFPATQSASSNANTLDDYEEGTWTASITFDGASAGVTYDTTPTCMYTKIGRQISVTGRFGLTNKGSSTGHAKIAGLPFPSANTGNAGYVGVPIALGNGTTFANQIMAQIPPNSSNIELQEVTEAGVYSTITNADFSNGSNMLFAATYFID